MRRINIIFMLTVLNLSAFGQDNLYPILKAGLWGYIDKTGTEVISPQFKSAGEFREGLAAVRLNGTYGYIDKSGSFLIKPKYDLALYFQKGQAKVFLEGKPYFVDKKGNITFQHNFKSISSFENHSFTIAITQTEKYCLINREGKLITDTVFTEINPFDDGVAVVYGLNHLPYAEDSTQIEKFETGVIDSTGKWLIHYDTYKNIGKFNNGYAFALRFSQTNEESGWTDDDVIIDRNGKLKFILPVGKYLLDINNKGFYDDLAVVEIYPEKKDSTESSKSYDKRKYMGIINTDGAILFSDTNWQEILPFRFNRAFVQDKSKKWKLINTKGKQVSDSTFLKILYNSYRGNPDEIFQNGKAWVKLSSGWVAIDTSGRILTQPKEFTGIHDSRLSRVGDIIFLEEDISVESDNYSYRYGFWNSKTNTTVIPTYHDIDKNGFNDDLIYAMKDGIIKYINSSGEVIWKGAKSKKTSLSNLNIDFMNRGYFYAYSKPNNKDLGGFGGSSNYPKAISKSITFPQKELSVVVHPELKKKMYGDKNAITVYIGNTTDGQIDFNAQDSRLYMKVQALNSNGEWKDIEYLPSSWCGNSYHTLTLDSKHYWTFLTPIYEGEFKTKLRIELKYIDPTDKSEKLWDKNEFTVYSNEFEGSINPGQFWNKRDYYPSGLMDPYND